MLFLAAPVLGALSPKCEVVLTLAKTAAVPAPRGTRIIDAFNANYTAEYWNEFEPSDEINALKELTADLRQKNLIIMVAEWKGPLEIQNLLNGLRNQQQSDLAANIQRSMRESSRFRQFTSENRETIEARLKEMDSFLNRNQFIFYADEQLEEKDLTIDSGQNVRLRLRFPLRLRLILLEMFDKNGTPSIVSLAAFG